MQAQRRRCRVPRTAGPAAALHRVRRRYCDCIADDASGCVPCRVRQAPLLVPCIATRPPAVPYRVHPTGCCAESPPMPPGSEVDLTIAKNTNATAPVRAAHVARCSILTKAWRGPAHHGRELAQRAASLGSARRDNSYVSSEVMQCVAGGRPIRRCAEPSSVAH